MMDAFKHIRYGICAWPRTKNGNTENEWSTYEPHHWKQDDPPQQSEDGLNHEFYDGIHTVGI